MHVCTLYTHMLLFKNSKKLALQVAASSLVIATCCISIRTCKVESTLANADCASCLLDTGC